MEIKGHWKLLQVGNSGDAIHNALNSSLQPANVQGLPIVFKIGQVRTLAVEPVGKRTGRPTFRRRSLRSSDHRQAE